MESDWVRPDQPSKCQYGSRPTSPHSCNSRSQFEREKLLPNVLHYVHNTPLIRINKINEEERIKCELLVKCEFLNAGGSVKDRIALRMIEDAEKAKLINPGDNLVEPTSGNTGIGLALAATIKGYKCTIVIPEKMSREKIDILRGLNARIIRTPTSVAFSDRDSHIRTAARVAREDMTAYILDQYRNASNPLAHYDITAQEILNDCDGRLDMLVCGVGTGGTITGIGRKLKERLPNCKIIAVDPYGSKLASPDDLNATTTTFYEIEGIGGDFLPTTLDKSVIDKWYKCNDRDSFRMARRLIRREGLLCGGSSGAAMSCAIQAAKDFKLDSNSRVVVILPDSIRNYMSKFLSDEWMKARGFLDDEKDEDHNTKKFWWKNSLVRLLQTHNVKKMWMDTKLNEVVKHFDGHKHEVIAVSQPPDHKIIGTFTTRQALSAVISGKVQNKISEFVNRNFKQVLVTDTLGHLSILFIDDPNVLVFTIDPKDNTRHLVGYLTKIDLADYISHNK